MSDSPTTHPCDENDRRVRKTQKAITTAFSALFVERGLDGVSVGDIVARADIARSTFYQHFNSKEAVLCAVVRPIIAPLAEAVRSISTPPHLPYVTQHLWDNRKLARELFAGTARRALIRLLADMIETSVVEPAGAGTGLPQRLKAIHAANAQIGLLEEWLTGKHHCSNDQIAASLAATGRALGSV